MRFSDKVAVVTGADSGIGRATATRLLAEGATVFAVDVQHTQPWQDPGAGRLRLLDLDVADPAAPEQLDACLRAEARHVDVLANVAGILHIAPFLEVSREDWERVLAVNLTGVFFLSQAVARIMVDEKTAGRIVTVSSVHAVVSGAASGIGRATAVWMARDGYEVAMMDLDAAGLTETRAQIESIGGKAHQFAMDLCDPLAVGSVTREIAVTVGAPEVLVNVAGVGVAATVLETSDADWSRVLAVNLKGPFLTTRAAPPLMLDRGSGVIVNIASVGGLVGLARRAAYCASKAGLIGLTKAIAVDHARAGIRCVAICAGTVETEWIGKDLG